MTAQLVETPTHGKRAAHHGDVHDEHLAEPTGRHRPDPQHRLVPEGVLLDPDNPVNTGPLTVVSQPKGRRAKQTNMGKVAVTTGMLALVATGAAVATSQSVPQRSSTGENPIVTGQSEIITADSFARLHEPAPEIKVVPAGAGSGPAPAPAPAPPPPPPPAPVNEVVVQPGDTVGKIAARHGRDVGAVLAANGLGPYTIIYPGQKLVLSGPAKAAPPAAPAPRAAAPIPRAAPPPPPPPPAAPAPAPAGTRAAAIYNAAAAQLGRTQDCTMLVTNALATVGIRHHGWPVSYLSLGTVIPASQAVPGDLLYYANGGAGWAHIAVYAGNGEAIHGGWNGNQTIRFSATVGYPTRYAPTAYIRVA